MSSGDSPDDRTHCDKIFTELRSWQSYVSRNAAAIRTALDIPNSKQLDVRMAFDNRTCCFYEPTIGARPGGFTLAGQNEV